MLLGLFGPVGAYRGRLESVRVRFLRPPPLRYRRIATRTGMMLKQVESLACLVLTHFGTPTLRFFSKYVGNLLCCLDVGLKCFVRKSYDEHGDAPGFSCMLSEPRSRMDHGLLRTPSPISCTSPHGHAHLVAPLPWHREGVIVPLLRVQFWS